MPSIFLLPSFMVSPKASVARAVAPQMLEAVLARPSLYSYISFYVSSPIISQGFCTSLSRQEICPIVYICAGFPNRAGECHTTLILVHYWTRRAGVGWQLYRDLGSITSKPMEKSTSSTAVGSSNRADADGSVHDVLIQNTGTQRNQ
ncbi:hypothetical protein MPTK1_7g01480 [Marchantia polymorpha subsp. ruderalis]|uniref:Uncharacterized protein n=2 Tax=Marchantia polymorpha TaxID=3197 RepID=A0AAF6BV22_MARPO|nr:hypothetical protein MARPO_0099s0023 [Marchantia polymorpha]BBN15856.1 hypothetical protein Mp_7g01480 [Marchantia polymorpha subsp. ruderalis]|eukprot:PTQ32385.1 hypothetical protein MARPO_0099s0023 [Marchantia polymorpha]